MVTSIHNPISCKAGEYLLHHLNWQCLQQDTIYGQMEKLIQCLRSYTHKKLSTQHYSIPYLMWGHVSKITTPSKAMQNGALSIKIKIRENLVAEDPANKNNVHVACAKFNEYWVTKIRPILKQKNIVWGNVKGKCLHLKRQPALILLAVFTHEDFLTIHRLPHFCVTFRTVQLESVSKPVVHLPKPTFIITLQQPLLLPILILFPYHHI